MQLLAVMYVTCISLNEACSVKLLYRRSIVWIVTVSGTCAESPLGLNLKFDKLNLKLKDLFFMFD